MVFADIKGVEISHTLFSAPRIPPLIPPDSYRCNHIGRCGHLVHVPAGTMHWFRFGKGGGEMISITSREAASLFFTDVDRAISPDAPDIPKLVEVAHQHNLTVAP